MRMPAFIVNGKVICSLLSAGEKVNKNNKETFDKKYKTKGAMRNGITAACVIINSAVYFLANYESAIYCVAIGIAAHIYCYPSRKEYNNLLEGNTTK